LHWTYVPGLIRSFRDVGWDDEDLTNGLQQVKISGPVTFSCEARQRRRCTGAKPLTMEQLKERIQNVNTNVPHDFLQKTGFHSRSFEEAGGCRRCLHWILSYACIFPFKKVHVKTIFVTFALEIQKLWPFLNAYILPPILYITSLHYLCLDECVIS
jgi:hypothetical protein